MPTPPAPPLKTRTRPLQQRLLELFTARLPAKLAALFLALILWLMVGTEEPTNEWVDVRLALALDSTVALRDSAPQIQALVVGRARELLKLYTGLPVIHRVIPGNIPDEVTLELRPEDVMLPGNVSAKVTNIAPRTVHLRFHITESRRVPVRARVQVAADSGLRVTGQPDVTPESVLVRGPREVVRTVAYVPTQPAHLDVRDTATTRTVQLDTTGLGVRVTPAEVRVRVSAARDTVVPPAPPPPLARDSAPEPASPHRTRRGP